MVFMAIYFPYYFPYPLPAAATFSLSSFIFSAAAGRGGDKEKWEIYLGPFAPFAIFPLAVSLGPGTGENIWQKREQKRAQGYISLTFSLLPLSSRPKSSREKGGR